MSLPARSDVCAIALIDGLTPARLSLIAAFVPAHCVWQPASVADVISGPTRPASAAATYIQPVQQWPKGTLYATHSDSHNDTASN